MPRVIQAARGTVYEAFRESAARHAQRDFLCILALNTSGGQLSMGQAGAAAGFLGITETVRQLTGAALGAAVPRAQVGLASGFGMINYDRGLCCGAAILAGGGS